MLRQFQLLAQYHGQRQTEQLSVKNVNSVNSKTLIFFNCNESLLFSKMVSFDQKFAGIAPSFFQEDTIPASNFPMLVYSPY